MIIFNITLFLFIFDSKHTVQKNQKKRKIE